ncbi:MAG: hypothetical protein ACRD68_11375, partial [Pyrinomonadaceae bacterium]
MRTVVILPVLIGGLSLSITAGLASRVRRFTAATESRTGTPLPRSSPEQTRRDILAGGPEKVLKKHEVIRLDAARAEQSVRRAGRLTLATASETLEIELEPHDMRAPDYRAEEVDVGGAKRPVAAGPVNTFKGRVRGRENSHARFTVDGAAVEGLLIIDGERHFVEPMRRYSKSAGAEELVFYKESDVIRNSPASCAVTAVDKVRR